MKRASKILVISKTVKTCKTLKLQKSHTFKIQLIGEQSMQVPNWQYHSKCRNTLMSVFEGYISLYFLSMLISTGFSRILLPSCRCNIFKDSLANFSGFLINSWVACILYLNCCKQKSDNIFVIYAHSYSCSCVTFGCKYTHCKYTCAL